MAVRPAMSSADTDADTDALDLTCFTEPCVVETTLPGAVTGGFDAPTPSPALARRGREAVERAVCRPGSSEHRHMQRVYTYASASAPQRGWSRKRESVNTQVTALDLRRAPLLSGPPGDLVAGAGASTAPAAACEGVAGSEGTKKGEHACG
jgi:hypothetical protein